MKHFHSFLSIIVGTFEQLKKNGTAVIIYRNFNVSGIIQGVSKRIRQSPYAFIQVYNTVVN